MREGDDLFFAPNVRFSSLDLTGERLPDQLRARVEGYYLKPAGALCVHEQSQHAFAAGLLLICALDFLAGLAHTMEELEGRPVEKDFVTFVKARLPSFKITNLAKRLFDDFRNGLVHECRIKNAGEFSFDHQAPAQLTGGRLSVNPRALLQEVRSALDHEVSDLHRYQDLRAKLARRVRKQFAAEIGIVERVRRMG